MDNVDAARGPRFRGRPGTPITPTPTDAKQNFAAGNLSAQIGLSKHTCKTKLLKINTTNNSPITLGGKELEEVEAFTYPGSIVNKHGGTDTDVKETIGKARAVFLQLRNIWNAKAISTHTKLRIFNSIVKSVLLYGSETWRTTKPPHQRSKPSLTTASDEFLGYTGQKPSVMRTCGNKPSRDL